MKKNTISPLKDLTGLILILSTTFINHGALAGPAAEGRKTEGEVPGRGMEVDRSDRMRRNTTIDPLNSSKGAFGRRGRRNQNPKSGESAIAGKVEDFAIGTRIQQAGEFLRVSPGPIPLNFEGGVYRDLMAKVLQIDPNGSRASSTLMAKDLVETTEFWALNRSKVSDPASARRIDEIVGQALITFAESLRQMDEMAKTSVTADPTLDKGIASDLQARAVLARFAGSQLGAILREALNKSEVDLDVIEAYGKKLDTLHQTVLRDKGPLQAAFRGEGISPEQEKKNADDFVEACAKRI